MTKKKIMIPIMSIMLATSSMTAIPSLTSVYAAQAVQEAYTYQVGTQEGKQYIVLTDYKGSEEKITIPDQINGIEVKSIQDGFGKNSKLKSITLSKNIASEKDTKRSLAGLNQITTLEEIQTVKDNAAYQSEEGILYTKDKKELVGFFVISKDFIISNVVIFTTANDLDKCMLFAHFCIFYNKIITIVITERYLCDPFSI